MPTPTRPDHSRTHAPRPRASTRVAPTLLGVALSAAWHGHYVFPLWPLTKIPRLHSERDCRRSGICAPGHLGWEQQATTDPAQIRSWWTDIFEPTCNVGIACGPSGLYVIDLDPITATTLPEKWAEWQGARHGREVPARLATQAGQSFPDSTFQVATPTPSEHHYYRYDHQRTDHALRNTAGRVGPGVDSRGGGGFIVAAGSRRADGAYVVARKGPTQWLPEWLESVLQRAPRPELPRRPLAAVRPLSDPRRARYLAVVAANVADATPGTANTTLSEAAFALGRLVAGGEFTDHDVRDTLLAAAHHRHIPPAEANDVISRGLAAGAKHGRTLDNPA